MKLSEWATQKNGLDYNTAYRLHGSGRFPWPVEQLPTGTFLVYDGSKQDHRCRPVTMEAARR
ncbi:MAG: hypothetical protein E6K84_03140 [Thaumarchaeota archaeon]|nr:MAG: hypothetical protein E6K84_03140 [Nitrososphaerota archaeon]